MVEAGIPAVEALLAGTTGGFKALGGDKCGYMFGGLEKGYRADMIGLAGDPTQDIRALRDVRFVMKNGEICKQDAIRSANPVQQRPQTTHQQAGESSSQLQASESGKKGKEVSPEAESPEAVAPGAVSSSSPWWSRTPQGSRGRGITKAPQFTSESSKKGKEVSPEAMAPEVAYSSSPRVSRMSQVSRGRGITKTPQFTPEAAYSSSPRGSHTSQVSSRGRGITQTPQFTPEAAYSPSPGGSHMPQGSRGRGITKAPQFTPEASMRGKR